MKKTFEILVAGTLTVFFGMATVAQGQLPTDRYGTPIYANQEAYYGAAPLPGGCLSGNCGNHAVGPLVGNGYAGAPVPGPVGVPYGVPCTEPCGMPCEPCGPCFAGPCLPRLPLPCLPCLPCVGGGGILNRIWNGPNYWQGTGCSERVIDELRKSWQHCPQCDLMGENINGRSGNTIGTGLRSAQLVNMGAPYGPIKMNAGQPENGYYSAPTRPSAISTPGGCSSCQKGITVTANSPQNLVPVQNYAPVQVSVQNPTQNVTLTQNYAPARVPAAYMNATRTVKPATQYVQQTPVFQQEQVAQPVQYAQSIQNLQPTQTFQAFQATPTFQPAQPTQGVQGVQPVQYTEPVQKSYRNTGSFRYRTNYAPSVEGTSAKKSNSDKPGYLRAMENAEKNGLGFDSVSEKPQESAWRAIPVSGNSTVSVLPATSTEMETVATPTPRQEGTSVLSGTPGMEAQVAYPSAVQAVPAAPIYPVAPVDACGPVCDPCFGGPCFGGSCFGSEWPGLIPLAARTAKVAGIAAYRTGRAAVIGTGMVAHGALRTVGFVLWNRPLPGCGAFCGPVCDPCGPVCDPCGPVVGGAPMMDPVYAENDLYLNAGYRANSPSGMVANNAYVTNNGYLASSSISANVSPVSNLYEDGYYPQNYNYLPNTVAPMTSVASTNIMPNSVPTMNSVPATNVVMNTVPLKPATGTATLLSYDTQRVYTEDGTEVIIEHDAMLPESRTENRLENVAVQYASAKNSVNTGISETASAPVLHPANMVPYQTVSVASQQDVPLEDVPNTLPAPTQNTVTTPAQNTEVYPIVAAERPQIQLAPGEVLVSQEDFILLPAGEVSATPSVPASNNSTLQSTPVQNVPVQTIPLESVTVPSEAPATTPSTAPAVKPIRDMNVTRVSFVQPITPTQVKPEPEKPAVYRTTDTGWQVKVAQ
ncbi:MAG: hypothetical protein Q4C70_06440 [Planctomycetia bacterium]|nr:hypothetical protein [Planctomycetia bacterium]